MIPNAGKRPLRIAVIGQSEAEGEIARMAREVGRLIAKEGWVLLCGGLGGVMEEAARGAAEADGLTVGILPGKSASEANPYIRLPIVTAMSHARNAILVRTADGLIAVGGKYGTLSEIALALVLEKPVIGLKTWEIEGVEKAEDPAGAVAQLKKKLLSTV